MPKLLPPVAHLRECFIYRPETGELIWRIRPREHFVDARSWARCNTMYAGNSAGNIDKAGYFIVLIGKAPYKVHRIAWKLMTDWEPPSTIDHINGLLLFAQSCEYQLFARAQNPVLTRAESAVKPPFDDCQL